MNIIPQLPLEICQEILESLDFLSQIRLRQTCKYLNLLSIIDFYNIPFKYTQLLTNEILEQHRNIKYLNISSNNNITTVNALKFLTKLDISDCIISNSGITNCYNLTELDASYNPYITNINHLTELTKLFANYTCGITDNGLSNCTQLIELHILHNSKITDINHCVNLQILEDYKSSLLPSGRQGCINLKSITSSNSDPFNSNEVLIYSFSYNILRIMSGCSGMAYSN